MRTVTTVPPSFPESAANRLLDVADKERWQVMCGDAEHWRVGMYSPVDASPADIHELEWHDCPELFLLIQGRLTLLVFDGGAVKELALEPLRPVLITAPHNGFCPDGPHTGLAVVVERDRFRTIYRTPEEWAAAAPPTSSRP
jgi:hypothetical protein